MSVIKDFDLFKIENGYFYSDNDNANAMQLHNNSTTKNESKSNTLAQVLNEIKLNQTRPIKLNEIIKK